MYLSQSLPGVNLKSEMLDRFGTPPPEVRRLLIHSQIRVLAHGYRIRTIKLESGLANDSGYVVLEYVSQKLIGNLREKLQRQGLEVRTTQDRKGYVPMSNRLTRESDADRILEFVLKVLE